MLSKERAEYVEQLMHEIVKKKLSLGGLTDDVIKDLLDAGLIAHQGIRWVWTGRGFSFIDTVKRELELPPSEEKVEALEAALIALQKELKEQKKLRTEVETLLLQFATVFGLKYQYWDSTGVELVTMDTRLDSDEDYKPTSFEVPGRDKEEEKAFILRNIHDRVKQIRKERATSEQKT